MFQGWQNIIWQQFGAAIDMLANALNECPDYLWEDRVWKDPSDEAAYSQFWFITFHSLVWLDRYLEGSPNDFEPPPPFQIGSLPERPYSKTQLQAYLRLCRQKCQTTLLSLTDEKAQRICHFPWGEEVSYIELQLYSMRHVQEHAAQLSLHLGQKIDSELDWVSRADG